MKKTLHIFALIIATVSFALAAKPTGSYKLVVEGFDWGAGVNKVILSLSDTTSIVVAGEYSVLRQENLALAQLLKYNHLANETSLGLMFRIQQGIV